MKWRIDYEWGERLGDYDRTGSMEVEAVNVYGALSAWARAGGCINSRVVCVALVKEGKGKTLKAAGRKKTCEGMPNDGIVTRDASGAAVYEGASES